MAHQSAGGELLEHAESPLAHRPPAFEMGLEGRVPTSRRQSVQQATTRLGAVPDVVAHREAHCPALPETWPVAVPAVGSSARFMVRLIEPAGPLTSAPMSDPSSAVTCPVKEPKETALRAHRDATVLGHPDDGHLQGAAVSASRMIRVTTDWPCASGADCVTVPVTDVENGLTGTPEGSGVDAGGAVVVVAPEYEAVWALDSWASRRRRGPRAVRPAGSERAGRRKGGDEQHHPDRPDCSARPPGHRARPPHRQAPGDRGDDRADAHDEHQHRARQPGVGARAEPVDGGDRPARVGQPVHPAPGGHPDTAAECAGSATASSMSNATAPSPTQIGR